MTETESAKLPAMSIAITSQGVIMTGGKGPLRDPTRPRKPPKRGQIQGWSAKSARRFRRWIVEHDAPAGTVPAGVTLTVPGPVLTKDEQRKLWKLLKDWLNKKGWAAVWRLEVQGRGAQHWHIVLCLPESELAREGDRLIWKNGDFSPIGAAWRRYLNMLPEVDWTMAVPGQRGKLAVTVKRGDITGADRWSCHITLMPDDGTERRWRRYMHDHNTKTKQAQIAQGLGRHWGVINRDLWRKSPMEIHDMPRRQYWAVLRWQQRLATARVRDDRAPFGRRLRGRNKRGSRGSAVWFTDPDTVRRMVEYASTHVRP